MTVDDRTSGRAVAPLEPLAVAPWVVTLALVSMAFWITLPSALWAWGVASPRWWLLLVAGALVRTTVHPPAQAWATRRLRPKLLAELASRALTSGAFVSEPASVVSLARPIERGLLAAAPELVGTTVAMGACAVLASRRLSDFSLPLTVAFSLIAAGLRLAARPWLTASSEALLDASRMETQHLVCAAQGAWEITGTARRPFLEGTRRVAQRSARAERLHLARLRAVGSAQLALLMAPLAWAWWSRARTGASLTLHELALTLPLLAPALGALRALDALTLAQHARARLGVSASHDALRTLPEAPIELHAVTVRHGLRVALDRVNLTLPPRGVTVVLGPNGAGKSTLARVIAGVLRPQEGRCVASGVALAEVRPSQVAFVPQHPCFIEAATVLDNVRLVVPTATSTEVARALEALALEVPPDRLVSELSRGEQRRVAIARALLKRSPLLVLDEPDAWLDRRGREALAAVLRREGESRAVLWVTHRADLIDPTTRVVVLSQAHTVEADGVAREVQTASPTVRALLDALSDESFRFTESTAASLRLDVEEGQQFVPHGRRVGTSEVDELARKRPIE